MEPPPRQREVKRSQEASVIIHDQHPRLISERQIR
jgi:hypothetical protein